MEAQIFEPMRPNNRSRYAYEQIREAIIAGKLKPGTVLNQKRLGDQLNVSESPVREALRELAGEGFVKYEPQYGAIVSSMSKTELLNIMVVRHNLEIMAIELSLPNLTDKDIEKAKAVFDRIEGAASSCDSRGYGRATREFHACLSSGCTNDYLLHLLNLSWDRSEFTRSLAMFRFKPERLQASFEEHRQILEALKERKHDSFMALFVDHQKKTINAVKTIPEEDWPC